MKEKREFEEMIEDLEAISKDLESGKLSLDESVKVFEQGIEISKECSKILENAEKRISILIEKNEDELEEKDFQVS